jgi:hypothetical protein
MGEAYRRDLPVFAATNRLRDLTIRLHTHPAGELREVLVHGARILGSLIPDAHRIVSNGRRIARRRCGEDGGQPDTAAEQVYGCMEGIPTGLLTARSCNRNGRTGRGALTWNTTSPSILLVSGSGTADA